MVLNLKHTAACTNGCPRYTAWVGDKDVGLGSIQKFKMLDNIMLWPGFFNSLPARCSGSPVGVLFFLFFPLRVHFPAVLPLILYGLLPLWPGVGAEGTFSFKSKAFSTTIRSLILDP